MLQDPFYHGRDAFAFIEELDRSSTPKEVMDTLERKIARFGFDHSIFTGLDPKQRFDHQVLASCWPRELIELYTCRDYIKHDPIVRLCRRSALPFEWSESTYAQDGDPRTLETMDVFAQFRIQRGFIVPIRGPEGYEGCVGMEGVRIELPPGSKPALHLIALYAFNRIRQMIGAITRSKATLTSRERDVLLWTAHGKTGWEIAERLHISPFTVKVHMQSAFHKLRAVNRTHAIAIAVRDHIISV
jgi:LuxR family quorum sensing-dependent transcriptional regulator